MKRRSEQVLNKRFAPQHTIDELNEAKLKTLLERHFPDDAKDPQWIVDVANAIRDAHADGRITNILSEWPSDGDVVTQLDRVVKSSNELLEALSGTTTRREQKWISGRIWNALHPFWTLLYGPPEDGNFWQKDYRQSSELDQAFLLLRRLNQRSRRILRRLERADLEEETSPSGNRSDHSFDSFVMCVGRCSLLGGTQDSMTDRLEIFITEYLQEAGRTHTTRAAVRSRWNRLKGRDTEPWTEAHDAGVQNEHEMGESCARPPPTAPGSSFSPNAR
jgi:hypothetical protein